MRFFPASISAVTGLLLAATAAAPAALAAGTTERVSVRTGGAQGSGESYGPSISADGRHVAFYSDAADLVPGDTNAAGDIFVRDRSAGRTERVSLASDGTEAGLGAAGLPSISGDGRLVAFQSADPDLVPGDTNGLQDVFVHDRRTGRTRRVSVGPGGAQADAGGGSPSISGDGRLVAFASADLMPGDAAGEQNIYVHDRRTGTTTLASVRLGGGPSPAGTSTANPSISADGRFVTFDSQATNLVPGDTNGVQDAFVHNRLTGRTKRISLGPRGAQGDSFSGAPWISADGRFVAFISHATNLVPGDTNGVADVFLRDRRTGRTERVNLGPGGAQANNQTSFATISGDGRFVAFETPASNLVPGDTNFSYDVFVRVLRGRGG